MDRCLGVIGVLLGLAALLWPGTLAAWLGVPAAACAALAGPDQRRAAVTALVLSTLAIAVAAPGLHPPVGAQGHASHAHRTAGVGVPPWLLLLIAQGLAALAVARTWRAGARGAGRVDRPDARVQGRRRLAGGARRPAGCRSGAVTGAVTRTGAGARGGARRAHAAARERQRARVPAARPRIAEVCVGSVRSEVRMADGDDAEVPPLPEGPRGRPLSLVVGDRPVPQPTPGAGRLPGASSARSRAPRRRPRARRSSGPRGRA